jgi:adenylate kinase family enzyme
MAINSPSLTFIFFNGLPAAGKDTQSDVMVSEMPNAVKISTGDYIRAGLKDSGNRFHAAMEEAHCRELVAVGKNIPDFIIINNQDPEQSIIPVVVQQELERGNRTFLFAGFPRNNAQLDSLKIYLDKLRQDYDVRDEYIWLDAQKETARERSAKRRADDLTAGRKPRSDDDPVVLEGRFTVFEKDTMPMLEILEQTGNLHRIQAEGCPTVVNIRIREALRTVSTLEIPDSFLLPPNARR